MVKSFLILFCFLSFYVKADIVQKDEKKVSSSRVPELVEKLRGIEIKDTPHYEEKFNQSVKAIEDAVEQEKLFCSGEASDQQGQTLPSSQKKICMRELKKDYLKAIDLIFETKKKYLRFIHDKQTQDLTDVQQKLKTEIERRF